MDPLLRAELIADECIGGKPNLQAYKDHLGFWTIGVGHYLGETARMTSITMAECEALLVADVEEAEHVVGRLTPFIHGAFSSAYIVRYRALVSMAFNLGEERLSKFVKFLAAVNNGDWKTAAAEMANSKWAGQIQPSRFNRLKRMIELGTV